MKQTNKKTSISIRPEGERDWEIAKSILLQTVAQLNTALLLDAVDQRQALAQLNNITFEDTKKIPYMENKYFTKKISFTENHDFSIPFVDLLIDIESSFSKNEIKYILGFVADGHVMVQSCSEVKPFTGNRDYDYLTLAEINNIDEHFRQVVSVSINNLISREFISKNDVYEKSRISTFES